MSQHHHVQLQVFAKKFKYLFAILLFQKVHRPHIKKNLKIKIRSSPTKFAQKVKNATHTLNSHNNSDCINDEIALNAKSQAGIGRVNVLELFLLGRQVFRKLTFYLIKEEKVFQSLFKFSVTRDIPPSPSFLPFGAEKFPEKLKKVTASDSCKSNYLFFKKSVRKIMLQN